ncbi:multisubunit potassium/proton antiporter, PhaG subunit [Arsukibacterium tuosuense]|uniref:Multisubunit potassium/proton antiporter, PhaG subunit n=1 Tax=Arsukibacterium tuosuense TaxID=1323745 RepID=A0A285JAJ6_9GAMM|nr:Na+/H+ antiporter subunit G [Arsukibacterium tuosuense]SNY56897.1 multisubunit potassium/proton antiporter, PhaG subunit [Arsukibacterium tuosuense]
MQNWMEWAVAFFLLLGGSFVLIGSIGLSRMPDFFMRLHGPTKATTLGMGGILLGSIFYFSLQQSISVHELLITIFLLITAPISAHMLIKTALHHQLKAIERTRGERELKQGQQQGSPDTKTAMPESKQSKES